MAYPALVTAMTSACDQSMPSMPEACALAACPNFTALPYCAEAAKTAVEKQNVNVAANASHTPNDRTFLYVLSMVNTSILRFVQG
jgi:hypothetical protein